MIIRLVFILSCVAMLAAISFSQTAETPSQVSFVRSKDGTRIAVECMGKGPGLLIVHGGTGDRSRWKPLLPLFASHFTVCAMDRRGHGESEAGSNYNLGKESEDVAASLTLDRARCSSWAIRLVGSGRSRRHFLRTGSQSWFFTNHPCRISITRRLPTAWRS